MAGWHIFFIFSGMKKMFRRVNLRSTAISAVIAALLFCIPVFIYIKSASYESTWLLYMGSFLFLIVMCVHVLMDSKKRGNSESTVTLVFASHVATVAGVLIATALCFILLSVMVPGYLGSGPASKQLVDEPANLVKDKTDGLSFSVFMAATVINFSVGSFVGIIFPFAAKLNQKKDAPDPAPLHQRGTR
jgi:hypothetical protein